MAKNINEQDGDDVLNMSTAKELKFISSKRQP